MSGIPASERKQTNTQFYINAMYIRKDLTELLLRDFGVKDKVRNPRVIAKDLNMTPEDATLLADLKAKYDLDLIDEYPKWLIDDMRKSIIVLLRTMMGNIVAANSIYINSLAEYDERRTYQTRAIGNCYQLMQELQYISQILPINANKYMRHIEALDKEIALLKGWRKSDNQHRRRVEKDIAKRKAKELKAILEATPDEDMKRAINSVLSSDN